jgi:hypothetical protein
MITSMSMLEYNGKENTEPFFIRDMISPTKSSQQVSVDNSASKEVLQQQKKPFDYS